MVSKDIKFGAFIWLFALFLPTWGANLRSDLQSLIPQNEIVIAQILQNENAYIDKRNNVNYATLSKELKARDLLDLQIQNEANINITFKGAQHKALVLINAVTKSLDKIGYKYFLSSFFEVNEGIMTWAIVPNSRTLIDPGALYVELLKNRVYIKSIKKQGQTSFVYELDAHNAILDGIDLSLSGVRPKEAYFVTCAGRANISIKSQVGDSWTPLIYFFDKNLKLIQTIKEQSHKSAMDLQLPNGTFYVMIDDAMSLENIKQGLSINLR